MSKIFLQYLIMPFIAIILGWVMMVLGKKNKALGNKKLLIFVLLGSLIMAVPSLLGWIDTTFSPWLYLVAMAFHLIMGIVFIRAYRYYIDKNVTRHKRLLQVFVMFTILLLGGYVFALGYNFFHQYTLENVGKASGYIGATSMLIFFIPTIFYWTYLAFISIPFEIYKVWEYPFNTPEINFDGMDFDRLLVLDLEFSRKPDADERLRVKAKAPENITLGNWFRKFIDDYNYKFPASTIEYIQKNGDMHSWVFYSKKSFFHRRRLLDPDMTITENKIKENIKITSKRVIENFEEHFTKVKEKNN